LIFVGGADSSHKKPALIPRRLQRVSGLFIMFLFYNKSEFLSRGCKKTKNSACAESWESRTCDDIEIRLDIYKYNSIFGVPAKAGQPCCRKDSKL